MTFAQLEDSATKLGVDRRSKAGQPYACIFESLLFLAISEACKLTSNKSVELCLRAGSDTVIAALQKRLPRRAPYACWAWSIVCDFEGSSMFTMVNCYIPSCDIVVHVYLGSSVVRSHA